MRGARCACRGRGGGGRWWEWLARGGDDGGAAYAAEFTGDDESRCSAHEIGEYALLDGAVDAAQRETFRVAERLQHTAGRTAAGPVEEGSGHAIFEASV